MRDPFKLDSRIVIAAHHKAGTRYSYDVFAEICREFGWVFWHMQARKKPEPWDVAFHADATSERLEPALQTGCKVLHFIRHPKSLIASAARYHVDAEEAWLDRPDGRLGGRSYRDALRHLDSAQERLRFEMRNKSRKTIAEMLEVESADLGVPRMTVRLEDVSHDSSRRTYVDFLSFLGFEGEHLSRALEICVKHALWSMERLPAHSRGGVDDSWQSAFTAELHAEFARLFGNAEAALRYRAAFPTAIHRLRAREPARRADAPVLWLRVPKCAGTSIERTLDEAGLLARNEPAAGKVCMVPGDNATVFRMRHSDDWKRAWKFAVVRNPWDRLVSGWKYVAADTPLREILSNLPKKSDFHRWHHVTRPQSELLLDEQGRLLPDYLVRFERLEEDMDECCDRAGLPRLKLHHDKRGGRDADYRRYYDDETRSLVGEIFRRDIEVFGYAFD